VTDENREKAQVAKGKAMEALAEGRRTTADSFSAPPKHLEPDYYGCLTFTLTTGWENLRM
jgi:hypothetical protein